MQFCVTKNTKACSRHFVKGDFMGTTSRGRSFLNPNAVPTIFQWKKHSKERQCRSITSSQGCSETPQDSITTSSQVSNPVQPSSTDNISTEKQLRKKIEKLEKYLHVQKEAAEYVQKERDYLRCMLKQNGKNEAKRDFSLERFSHSDKDVSFYTGFPIFNALMQCFRLLDVGLNGKIYYTYIQVEHIKNPIRGSCV